MRIRTHFPWGDSRRAPSTGQRRLDETVLERGGGRGPLEVEGEEVADGLLHLGRRPVPGKPLGTRPPAAVESLQEGLLARIDYFALPHSPRRDDIQRSQEVSGVGASARETQAVEVQNGEPAVMKNELVVAERRVAQNQGLRLQALGFGGEEVEFLRKDAGEPRRHRLDALRPLSHVGDDFLRGNARDPGDLELPELSDRLARALECVEKQAPRVGVVARIVEEIADLDYALELLEDENLLGRKVRERARGLPRHTSTTELVVFCRRALIG